MSLTVACYRGHKCIVVNAIFMFFVPCRPLLHKELYSYSTYVIWTAHALISIIYNDVSYGTAQFKLEARVRVTRMCFVAPLEYFSKSCVSVDNCTRISRAIHARVTSPYMHACG